MGPTKTETATVFSNTTRSVFYCWHAPHIIWDLQDTTSPWVFVAVALPPAVLLNALIHVIIAVKRRRELKRTSNILLSSFGRYRSFSRKFVCTVICCGWTVSFLSSTERPLHLRAGLCCDIAHGHSHDLFDIPSDNDGTGKVRGHSKMDWLQSDGDSKPYEKADDNSLGISNSNCISTTLHYGIRRNDEGQWSAFSS